MNSEAIQKWLKERDANAHPGAVHDTAEEPWPISRVAPISERARQAFRNLGIID